MEDGSSCPYKCKWENSVFGQCISILLCMRIEEGSIILHVVFGMVEELLLWPLLCSIYIDYH